MSLVMAIEAAKHRIREELEFHIEDVEVQHRRLHQLVSELGVSSSRANGALQRSLENLIGYLEIHASDEEEFMRKYDYPENLLDSHLNEHQDIVDRLRTISASMESELLPDSRSIAAWIEEWLDDHEASDDSAYLEWFQERLPR